MMAEYGLVASGEIFNSNFGGLLFSYCLGPVRQESSHQLQFAAL
jgi:hypothetical protein